MEKLASGTLKHLGTIEKISIYKDLDEYIRLMILGHRIVLKKGETYTIKITDDELALYEGE